MATEVSGSAEPETLIVESFVIWTLPELATWLSLRSAAD